MIKKLVLKTLLLFSLSTGISFLLPYLNTETNFSTLVENSNFVSPISTNEPLVFASLPEVKYQSQASFKTADARPEILRQYLAKYKSDLEPYADIIVNLSDQYNFDYRWLVAIAQQESNLCKKIPENSYNCWGWGIYGDKVTRFGSYEEALFTIAPKFKETFLKEDHIKDPYVVMQKYTPPSDGSWAAGVVHFFKELE